MDTYSDAIIETNRESFFIQTKIFPTAANLPFLLGRVATAYNNEYSQLWPFEIK